MAAGVLLVGCGSDDAVETPAGLLSAGQVGGTAVEPTDEALESSGVDTDTLIGVRSAGMAVFQRDRDGAEEQVILKVRQMPPAPVEFGLDDVRACLQEADTCGSQQPGFERERVDGLPDGSLGFRSRFRDESGEVERSYLRSYTYVEDTTGFGQLVMVSLLREDGSDPEVADLVELTEAQVAKTEGVGG